MFLAIFRIILCVFLISHVFYCFSQFSTSYSVCFSFSMNFSFLAILQIIEYTFLISYSFIVSRHSPGQIVFVSCFTFFSVFALYLVLQCAFLVSHVFSVSNHIPGPTVCVSLFPWFSVFSTYSSLPLYNLLKWGWSRPLQLCPSAVAPVLGRSSNDTALPIIG